MDDGDALVSIAADQRRAGDDRRASGAAGDFGTRPSGRIEQFARQSGAGAGSVKPLPFRGGLGWGLWGRRKAASPHPRRQPNKSLSLAAPPGGGGVWGSIPRPPDRKSTRLNPHLMGLRLPAFP